MTMGELPTLGHISNLRRIDVPEPLERAPYIARGKHILIGQRKYRGQTDALILLGKCIEQTRVSNKYDANVWLDIRTPHVIYICGKRGSGKSYDLGIISEGLILTSGSKVTTKEAAITTVIFDTQSQFWALADAPKDTLPEDLEQLDQLRQWELPAIGLSRARLFKPAGESSDLPDVEDFVIDPAELDVDDWCGLFGLERYSPQGQCIRTLLQKVQVEGYEMEEVSGGQIRRVRIPPAPRHAIPDLIRCLRRDAEMIDQSQKQTRDAVLWKLESLQGSNLFQPGGLNIREVLRPGQISVFLLRNLDNATKSLVVSVLTKKIFRLMGDYHTKRKVSRRFGRALPNEYQGLPDGVWVLIDEAHLVCPADAHTAAKESLVEYVKRGRDAGLSLVLATQQPSAVDPRIVSQVDLLIVHRLVVDSDISAALARVPADFPKEVSFGSARVSDRHALVRALDTGEAWVADAETGRAFLVAMRPRVSAHGGDEPVVI
jgi:hypothetical protein